MKFSLRFILMLIAVTFLFQTGYACICLPQKIEKEVTQNDYLFVGKVTKIAKETVSTQETNIKFIKFFITFKIEQNIKGAKGKEITIIQYKFKRQIPCKQFIYFKKEKKYLVSANIAESKEVKVNNLCLRTKRLNKSQGKYKQLLELKKLKPNLF